MCDENVLTDLLPIYYGRLFPLDKFCKWLSYGGGKLNCYGDGAVCLFSLSFCPNLFRNIFSMPKFLQSYALLTLFQQNKYPFKVNVLNASQCTMQCLSLSDVMRATSSNHLKTSFIFSDVENLSLSWLYWETNIHRVRLGYETKLLNCITKQFLAGVQFVTPSFHPKLINNMFFMPKCRYLFTWGPTWPRLGWFRLG